MVLTVIPTAILFLFIVYIYTLTGAGVLFEGFAAVLGGLIFIMVVVWVGGKWVRKLKQPANP